MTLADWRVIGACGLVVLALAAGCERGDAPGGGTATQPATGASGSGATFENVKQQAQEAVDAAIALALEKRRAYQQKAEDELARLDQRVRELRDQAERAAETAKPEIQKRIDELQRKGDALRRGLGAVRDAAPEAWEKFKHGVDAALDEVRKATSQPAPPSSVPASQPSRAP